jgi:hypothetical protein
MNERDVAVRELALAIKAYDDANPEVGFPPLWYMHVDDALERLGLTREDVDYEALTGGRYPKKAPK